MSRFMDPTTDFGFKKLFGDEANKDITMSFLNDLLALDPPLVDLSFSNLEQLPEAPEQRIGIYDLFCRDVEGKEYLVEMQKSRIAFIKDRMVYYATFPIASQAKKGGKHSYDEYQPPSEDLRIHDVTSIVYGEETYDLATADWSYELKGVYCIAILRYPLKGSRTAVNRNSIRNEQPPHERFYDKLQFVTVELPLFDPRKPEYSLDHRVNQWLYFLKHLPDFERVPDVFKNDRVFQKAFWIAELANFTPEERRLYELNLKRVRDTYAVLSTSRDEGRAEGRIEGKIEDLLLLFSQKLGPIPAEIETALRALNDPEQIHRILAHFMEINDWEALRKYLGSSHSV
jgi:hypothetical protein